MINTCTLSISFAVIVSELDVASHLHRQRHPIIQKPPLTMMSRRVSLLATLLASTLSTSAAFSLTPFAAATRSTETVPSSTMLQYVPDLPETFDRALVCANTYGLCSIEELLDLSEGEQLARREMGDTTIYQK